MAILDFEVRVPARLADIKLKEYQEYMKVYDGLERDEEGNVLNTKEQNDFLSLKMLDIFCGLSLKESYKLPLKAFDSILRKVSDCFEEETPLIKEFTMIGSDGVEVQFGFIPKLDDMSLGEYIDLDGYIQGWGNMHKAMAVLYRPITFKKKGMYLIEDYEGTDKWADVMKDAPVNVALGAMVFFYRLGSKLVRYTMDYTLKKEMNSDNILLKQVLGENGGGINQFMASLEVMSEELTKLQKLTSTNVSLGYNSKKKRIKSKQK
jgi:hypothetical protein